VRWDTYQRQSVPNELPLIILQEDCYKQSFVLSSSVLSPAVPTHLIFFLFQPHSFPSFFVCP
jgi:hypothetical protein